MSAVATFDYASWIARYPELANTGPTMAALLYAEAGIYWNNTGWCGAVCDVPTQTMLMNMLTAHIAFLANGDINDAAASGAVAGHIDQATQGSVAISASIASNVPLTAAFFMQTKYGLAFWQATAKWRTARYRPSYRSPLVGAPYGYGGRFI
jgi:hypothetical protein